MHDDAPVTFFKRGAQPTRCHISREVGWTRRTRCLASTFAGSQPLGFFASDHLKSVVYETSVDTPEDLIARIVIVAADINATHGIFELVWKSFYDCVM